MSKERPGMLVMSYNWSIWAIFRDMTVSLQDGRRVYFPHGAQRMFREVHMQFYLQGLQLRLTSTLMLKVTLGRNKTKQNKKLKTNRKRKTTEERGRKVKALMGTQMSILSLGLLPSAVGGNNSECVTSLQLHRLCWDPLEHPTACSHSWGSYCCWKYPH